MATDGNLPGLHLRVGPLLGRDLRGLIVREVGAVQLRHAGHDDPMLGCPLCRTDRLRGTPSFDGWLHGRNA